MKRVSAKTKFNEGTLTIIVDFCIERPLITKCLFSCDDPITLDDCAEIAAAHANIHNYCGVQVYKTSMPEIIVAHQDKHSGAIYKRDYFDSSRQYWRQIGILDGYEDECKEG